MECAISPANRSANFLFRSGVARVQFRSIWAKRSVLDVNFVPDHDSDLIPADGRHAHLLHQGSTHPAHACLSLLFRFRDGGACTANADDGSAPSIEY